MDNPKQMSAEQIESLIRSHCTSPKEIINSSQKSYDIRDADIRAIARKITESNKSNK